MAAILCVKNTPRSVGCLRWCWRSRISSLPCWYRIDLLGQRRKHRSRYYPYVAKPQGKGLFCQKPPYEAFLAKERGVIIGSANLSSNGLSDSGLHEVAVLLPANSIDIKGLKARVNAVPVTPSSLRDLDTRTLQHRSRNDGQDTYPAVKRTFRRKPTVTTFANWYESEDKKFWRIFPYREYFRGLTPEAKHELRVWGYKTCEEYWMGAECHANPHEWLLSADTNKYGYGVYWSCADFTVPVKRTNKNFYDRRWPFFSVQIRPTRKYGKPPFKVDKAFFRDIKRLLMEAEVKSYMEGLEFAPNGLLRKRDLKRLYEYYLEEAGDN